MEITTPDQMILIALINGMPERALGMAQVVALYGDDADGNAVIDRIKGETFERMLAAHAADLKAQANVEEDARIEAMMASASKLEPNHPALMSKETEAEILEHDDDPRFDDDMGPDDRLQAERDAQDVAAALSEPLGEAIVAAQKAGGDDEMIF